MANKKRLFSDYLHTWDSEYFTCGQIFAMLVPLILDQFFIHGIVLLTTALVSSSGQTSLTAVGLVTPVDTMIYSFFYASMAGGSVIIAHIAGSKDARKLKSAGGQLLFATFAAAVIVAAVIGFAADPLVRLLFRAAEAEVQAKAASYLRGVTFSLIPHAFYVAAFTVFRGIGRTRVCMVLSVTVNTAYLLFSILFINFLHMDIAGASLAYITARTVGAVAAVLAMLFAKKAPCPSLRDIIVPEKEMLLRIVRTCVPFSVEQLCFNGGGIFVSMILVQLGSIQVAANTVTTSALNLFLATGTAVANLTVTVVGQCIGAGDTETAVKYGKKLVRLGEAALIVNAAVLAPFMTGILSLFHAPEEAVSLILRLLCVIFVFALFFWTLSNVLPNVLRSGGDIAFTSYASLITMWTFRVGGAYLLAIQAGMGVYGVWIACGIEYMARAVIYIFRFRSGKWKKQPE